MNKGFNNYQTLDGEPAANGKPNRSIQARVKDYELLKYLKPGCNVLDIGCNRGYFGIILADHLTCYFGIDHDTNELSHGLKLIGDKSNIILLNVSFEDYKSTMKYGGIFSFAVHVYSKLSMFDYATKINSLLNDGGHLFLEGHPTGYLGEPAKQNELKEILKDTFDMKCVLEKTVKDRLNNRNFTIWQK